MQYEASDKLQVNEQNQDFKKKKKYLRINRHFVALIV